MEVKILDVVIEESKCRVNFISQYGGSIAIWIGKTPKINSIYNVELEVRKSCDWQTDIVRVNEEPKIYFNGYGISIVGFFESIDNDGCADIRIGNALLLLETKGKPFRLKSKIKFSVEEIYLYEVNY